jgi:hypothetical protein
MHEIVLIQSVIAHLGAALRLLDRLDADVPAAHVDAALEALREEPSIRRSIQRLVEDREVQFSVMDEMIDKMFGEFVLLEPNSLPER